MDDVVIDGLRAEILAKIAAEESSAGLEKIRVEALGKSGSITMALKGLAELTAGQRKDKGAKLNQVKLAVSAALEAKTSAAESREMALSLRKNALDISLPVRPSALAQGRIHPVAKATEEITAIFAAMGFAVADGPDIEDDWHNFEALNFPPHHPARQMQDTFYMAENDAKGAPYLLRTHTSPVQIRTMEAVKPPIRVICPGRVYRADSDATHSPMFHQVEGLVVDKSTNMAHLKGCLAQFMQAFFEVEGEVSLRFRPSFFPFTEPSAEVDVGYSMAGSLIKVGSSEKWLEVLGCGMVHPNVLAGCGIDPEEYQGFAFGLGIDRLAMLKYGANDIRQFFESDTRWLAHNGFAPLDIPSLAAGLSYTGGEKL
ncbi:phenylalanine--tRNA ligase alpha subunit [Alphaproteobacteria bacterium]|nr:phenylalanine--tRNA ligase alpha subunit [Alphaproteobacteria bacterium]